MGSYIHLFVYPALYTRYQIKRINLIVDVNNQIPILGHQLSNFIVNFAVNLCGIQSMASDGLIP